MGTRYNVTAIVPEGFDRAGAQRDIDAILEAFNQIASTYIDDSEVNRVTTLPQQTWQEISQTLSDILLISLEVSWLTGGAFDVTVSPLVDLWGFGPEQRPQRIPDPQTIEVARSLIGFQHLQLDFTEPKLKKTGPVSVDLSAVAKGYGVDMLAQWLERQGVADYLVEIGGEIRAAGSSPRGDAWRIGIERPDVEGRAVEQAIRIRGVGLATSGDYRNYFEEEGVRYSHTLDPRTGYPIRHDTASVTVVAETAAYADALATGLLVLGSEKALALAETHGLAVYAIDKTPDGFKAVYSSKFAPYLHSGVP